MRTVAAALLAALFAVSAAVAEDVPLKNWAVPKGKVAASADVSGGSIFVAVTPCRVVDTRYPAGPFGGPSFSADTTRHYPIASSPCTGIPAAAAAYSLNFTIVNYNIYSSGYITAYPLGTTRPLVSTLNFGTGPALANAAIVPASSDGAISVYAAGATDLIIDINGYYADGPTVLNNNTTLTVQANVANGSAIWGGNYSPTGEVYGVSGLLLSSGAATGAGVRGYTPQGMTWGVIGTTDSSYDNSGGVLGFTFARVTDVEFASVGVRGDSDLGYGVMGLSSSDAGGVGGIAVNPDTGATGAYGLLGTQSYGVFSGGNFAAIGTKAFVDPHPTDASKVIRYVALEGPEAGTYFRGRGRFRGGKAVIDVPESFRLTTEEEGLTVHVTPVGGFAQVAVMKESLDGIVVQATRDVEFTYIVHGVRRGYAGFEPIGPGDEFRPRSASDTMPAYLNEEQKKRLVDVSRRRHRQSGERGAARVEQGLAGAGEGPPGEKEIATPSRCERRGPPAPGRSADTCARRRSRAGPG